MFNGTGRFKVRHLLILVIPAFGTLVVLAIWWLLWLAEFFVPPTDAELSTNAWLPTLGAIFGITAAVLLNRVIEEDVRVHALVDAVKAGTAKIEDLAKELKRRIHPLVHILMGTMTLLLLLGYITLPYQSFWSGVKDVGGSALSLFLYWKVARVLDNPLRSPWIRDVIPDDMRKQLEELEGAEE